MTVLDYNFKYFSQLPEELQIKIFGYDPLHKENMIKICQSIKAFFDLCKKRIDKEFKRLNYHLVYSNQFKAVIVYRGQDYKVKWNEYYPFEEPVVFSQGKKMCNVCWTPAARIATLIQTLDLEWRED